MKIALQVIVSALLIVSGFIAGDIYATKEMKTHIHSRTIQVWEP